LGEAARYESYYRFETVFLGMILLLKTLPPMLILFNLFAYGNVLKRCRKVGKGEAELLKEWIHNRSIAFFSGLDFVVESESVSRKEEGETRLSERSQDERNHEATARIKKSM